MMFDRKSSAKILYSALTVILCALVMLQCTTEKTDNNGSASQQELKKAKENTPELAVAMGQLQTYHHKFALAVEAKNYQLANFYLHEVEAAADGIKENIPSYEGYDIRKFMKIMFDSDVEPLETALANKNWDKVRQKTIDLTNSCNSCHNATAHGFVKITPGFDNNPFNQDFSVSE